VVRQAQLRGPPQRSGEYHQVNWVSQRAQFSHQTLTRFARLNRCWDAKSESNPTRSLPGAQKWLSETVYGVRSLQNLKSEIENSSDLSSLFYMAKNGRLREKKALTIVARKRGIPNALISAILHSSQKTTRRYFTVYSEAGPLFGSRKRHSKTPANSEKTRHILELLHQKPTAFGINRTSWTQRALIQAYKERHSKVISRCTVQRLVKKVGYSWRKARRVLTSPDPNYEEKIRVAVE
jgi:transposase